MALSNRKFAAVSHCIDICAVKELAPGQRRIVDIGDYDEVLVLNLDGVYYAINNVCPHAGAALERGTVVDGVLFCPLHQWGFCLSNGRAIDDDALYAQIYRVISQDQRLYL
ncbi:MAG: hypothetical protein ETSY2_37765, partial [Candidatus Entotheonella gemina]